MTAIIDIIENLSWREENGVVREITRGAIIELPTPQPYDTAVHFARLDPEMPQPDDEHPLYSYLFVKGREFRALGPTILQATITYRALEFVNPEGYNARIRGGSVLEQIEDQFDRFGNQITVEHGGIEQGGQVSVGVPRDYLQFELELQSAAPGAMTRAVIGAINSSVWNAGQPGEWRCDDAVFDFHDGSVSPPWWTFRFAFRYKAGGWNPSVVYIDPETGNPPPELVAGVGVKTVDYYEPFDFNSLNLIP